MKSKTIPSMFQETKERNYTWADMSMFTKRYIGAKYYLGKVAAQNEEAKA